MLIRYRYITVWFGTKAVIAQGFKPLPYQQRKLAPGSKYLLTSTAFKALDCECMGGSFAVILELHIMIVMGKDAD